MQLHRMRQLRLQALLSATQGCSSGHPPTILIVDPEEGTVITESPPYPDPSRVEERRPSVQKVVVHPDGRSLGIALEESKNNRPPSSVENPQNFT